MADLLARLAAANAALRCRPPAPYGRPTQRAALDAIAALEDAALARLRAARDAGDARAAGELLGCLVRFWWMRGRTKSIGLPEADATLPLLLRAAAAAPVPAAADSADVRAARAALDAGLLGAVQLYYAAAQYPRAREAHAAVAAQDSGDALNLLGMIDREQSNLENALRLHDRARKAYAAEGDAWGEAHAISNEGVCYWRRELVSAAEAKHTEALARRRELDDTLGIASSLGNLALIHHSRHFNHALALQYYEESMRMREELGDAWGVAGSLVAITMVKRALREPHAAANCALRALDAFARVGDELGLTETAEAAALVAEDLENFEAAVQCAGTAFGLRRRIQTPAEKVSAHLARLSNVVPPASFVPLQAAAYKRGLAGSVEGVRDALVRTQAEATPSGYGARHKVSAATVAAVAIGVALVVVIAVRAWRRR